MRKVVLIVQARVGSTRLPRKILLDLCGKPVIQRILERVRNSTLVDKFILAIPDSPENTVLSEFADAEKFSVFRGREEDVVDRFYQAIINQCDNPQKELVIVRVCADNPFVDPCEIDRLIAFFLKGRYDYAFNHIPALENMYPDGLGAEALTFSTLKRIWRGAVELSHREHVTKYIWDNMGEFEVGVLRAPFNIAFPEIKLDIDTEKDFAYVERLCKKLIEIKSENFFSGVEVVNEARNL